MNILFLKSAWSRLTISNQFLTMMMKNAHWEHLDNFACNDKAKKSVEMPKVTIRLNRFSLGQTKYHSGISRAAIINYQSRTYSFFADGQSFSPIAHSSERGGFCSIKCSNEILQYLLNFMYKKNSG